MLGHPSRPNDPIRQCHIPTSRDIAILHWQIIVRVGWSYFILLCCSSTQPQRRYRLRLCFNLISYCTAPAQTFPFLGHRNTAVQLGLCGTLLFFKLMCPPLRPTVGMFKDKPSRLVCSSINGGTRSMRGTRLSTQAISSVLVFLLS